MNEVCPYCEGKNEGGIKHGYFHCEHCRLVWTIEGKVFTADGLRMAVQTKPENTLLVRNERPE
jgi:ribosomal protein L37AE/L43A